MHVEALNVGIADLSVEVILRDGTRLSHAVMVEVIPAMRLTLPPKARTAGPLLIAPHTKVFNFFFVPINSIQGAMYFTMNC